MWPWDLRSIQEISLLSVKYCLFGRHEVSPSIVCLVDTRFRQVLIVCRGLVLYLTDPRGRQGRENTWETGIRLLTERDEGSAGVGMIETLARHAESCWG